jgi:hypothetical protein
VHVRPALELHKRFVELRRKASIHQDVTNERTLRFDDFVERVVHTRAGHWRSTAPSALCTLWERELRVQFFGCDLSVCELLSEGGHAVRIAELSGNHAVPVQIPNALPFACASNQECSVVEVQVCDGFSKGALIDHIENAREVRAYELTHSFESALMNRAEFQAFFNDTPVCGNCIVDEDLWAESFFSVGSARTQNQEVSRTMQRSQCLLCERNELELLRATP